MCLIIEKPVGKTIPLDVIRSASVRNSDGVGIMCNGHFDKWLDIKPDRIKEKTDALKDEHVGVHFRFATDGPVNRKMAHPFKLSNGQLLMHNGVISSHRPTALESKEISDTVKFIRHFVNPHIKRNNGKIDPEIVSNAAGYSAFLLMDQSGETARFGNGWVSHYDLWFSNEYAWNAPKKVTQWFGGNQYDAVGGTYDRIYEDYDYTDQIDDDNYLAGEKLRALLMDYSAELNPGYIDVSYSDGDVLDEVFNGTISVDTFLQLCDATSLLRLFVKLCRDHRVSIR